MIFVEHVQKSITFHFAKSKLICRMNTIISVDPYFFAIATAVFECGKD